MIITVKLWEKYNGKFQNKSSDLLEVCESKINNIPFLEDEDDFITITDYEKAEVLNNFIAVSLHMKIQGQFLF